VFTEVLPSKEMVDTNTDTENDGMDLKVRRLDWLRCHDVHTNFHKDMFRHSEVSKDGFTGAQTQRQQDDLICLRSLFFQNKQSKLKISIDL
jgi:hypothetical protein